MDLASKERKRLKQKNSKRERALASKGEWKKASADGAAPVENPFEIKKTRRRFQVVNEKVKGDVQHVAQARDRGIKKVSTAVHPRAIIPIFHFPSARPPLLSR